MKKTTLLCILLLIGYFSFAQSDVAKVLVDEGVALHDRGEYQNAIAKYDEALKADPDNLLALAEKAYSLISLGKAEETVEVCQYTLEKHKGSSTLHNVYVTYGNALDLLKQPKKSLAIYNQGIKQFPDYYMLHFNKGITLVGLEKYDEACESLHAAIAANPDHASSHNALARISEGSNEKIRAALAYSRFIVLEPKGKRAQENARSLVNIASSGAQRTGENAVTISLDPATLKQAGKKSKKENDFSSAEFFLSMSAAMDYEKENQDQTATQRFARKMESLFSYLQETANDNKGFFWDHYVPYFAELKEKKLMEAFSNVVLGAAGDVTASEWLNTHAEEVEKFRIWSKGYAWK